MPNPPIKARTLPKVGSAAPYRAASPPHKPNYNAVKPVPTYEKEDVLGPIFKFINIVVTIVLIVAWQNSVQKVRQQDERIYLLEKAHSEMRHNIASLINDFKDGKVLFYDKEGTLVPSSSVTLIQNGYAIRYK